MHAQSMTLYKVVSIPGNFGKKLHCGNVVNLALVCNGSNTR